MTSLKELDYDNGSEESGVVLSRQLYGISTMAALTSLKNYQCVHKTFFFFFFVLAAISLWTISLPQTEIGSSLSPDRSQPVGCSYELEMLYEKEPLLKVVDSWDMLQNPGKKAHNLL